MRISDWSSDVCSSDLPSLLPVLCGSHLDTQPLGGRFDGVYGVLAGLEVLRTFNAQGIATRHSVEVVAWTNEEGSRFTPGVLGSAVYAGRADLAFARARPCLTRSEEHTSEFQSLMRISYAVFCLKHNTQQQHTENTSLPRMA